MMKKINFVVTFFLLTSFIIVKSQTIKQLGYHSINGIMALSSKTNLMVLGNGDIVSISDPVHPALTGNVSFPGFSTSVLVSEDYAYFGTGMSVNLIIADISNPGFPLTKGSLSFPELYGGIFGMTKTDTILYLAMGADGVYSVNISDKDHPSVLDTLVIENGQARDIVAYANYAYVAHFDGLKILDISNPSNLHVITTIGSGYYSIDVNDTLVFLGKESGGIDVFNIADPFNPAPYFSIPNSGSYAWDVKYCNNHLYLATDIAGLFMYKIEENTGKEIGHFPNTNNGQSFAVSFQDSLILLSGLINGVAILKYDSIGITGLNDESENDPNVFPNPANNYIEFSQNHENITEIEIININGESVLRKHCKNTTNRIDISNLPKGNYIVSFGNNKIQWKKKLIKIE